MRKFWRAIVNRRRFETELDDELRFHVEALAADLERSGLGRAEAMRRARISVGRTEHYKEECRQARGLRWLDELWGDLRYGLRGLRRTPAYAVVACLTLTLGFGATATIFSLVNSVMFKTLPVEKPEELQAVYWTLPRDRPGYQRSSSGSSTRDGALRVADMFSYPHFKHLRREVTKGADLFAHTMLGRVSVTIHGQAQLGRVLMTSWNYFRGLGVKPLLGRTFVSSDEDVRGAPPAAILNYQFWASTFGGSANALGQTLEIGDMRVVVVGVLPPGFHGLNPGETMDVIVPLTCHDLFSTNKQLDNERNWWVQMMARLEPGYPGARFGNEMETRLAGLLKAAPVAEPYEAPKIRLVEGARGLHWLRRRLEQPLHLLMLVAALILLMAAVNVGGLMLARAEARATETGVRLALGSSRARLTRQHLTESLLLAVLGLLGGLALAWLLSGTLPMLLSEDGVAPVIDLTPDWRFLLAAILAMLASTTLFGLYPAWRSARTELTAALRRSAGARAGRLPMGRILVGAQIGLSLVLLVSAAMFLRTVANLRSLELGFVPDRLLVFGTSPADAGYRDSARVSAYFDRAREQLAALPGVKSVGLSQHGLLTGSNSGSTFSFRDSAGRLIPLDDNFVHQISPGFFATVGIPVLLGRDIRASDTSTSHKVALVNQKVARMMRPDGGSPVGMMLIQGKDAPQQEEVIGVVGDAKYATIRDEAPITIYTPMAQREPRSATFYLKTAGDPLRLVQEVRRVMAGVDARVPIYDLRTQEEQINLAMEQERILARLLSGFGALALLLAAIGVYGVLSYSVARRTPEIGIRSALGASPASLLGLILGESLWPVGLGLAAGLIGAWWFTRLMDKLVFGIKPMDGWSVTAAVVVLVCAAAISAWVPARRASRVAPMTALRCD
jgi:predicted permease